MRRLAVTLATLLMGCSVVNDPGAHREPIDAGPSGMDAGDRDAGPEGVDAGNADGGMIDAGPDGGPPPELAYCQQYASILCQGYQSCCTRMPPPSYPNCLMENEDACLGVFAPPGGLPTSLAFDPAIAATTLAELQGFIDSCSTDIADWAIDPTGFFAPLVGNLPTDAECTPVSLDPIVVLRAVLSCGTPGQVCRPVMGTMDWRCGPRGINGEECTYGFECMSDRCNRRVARTDICGDGAANGEACLFGRGDQCASLVCAQTGLFTFQCAPLTQEAIYCRGGD